MIIVLDSAFSSHLGAARLFEAFGRTPTTLEMAALELSLLMGLTAAFAAYQFQHARRKLGLRALADVDARLHADANYIGRRLAAGRPRFLITANVLDGNAFCLSMGRYPTVVLGGGLRLILRKKRQHALAVIAHECGHVSTGDTLFLFLAWYSFIAYTCLLILQVAFSQYSFWTQVPGVYTQWLAAGFGSWDFLKANFPAFFLNGIPKLFEAVGLGVVLVHFVRQREYRADEVAAQAGWRAPLIEALTAQAADARSRPLSLFARFHPRAAQRAARLQDESKWGQLNFVFVVAMSFVLGRFLDKVPSPAHGLLHDRKYDLTEQEIVFFAVSMLLESSMILTIFPLLFFVFYITTLHINRVSMTQLRHGHSVWTRLGIGSSFVAANFAGILLSALMQEDFLETFALGQGVTPDLYRRLYFALSFAFQSGLFFFGAVVAATIMAKRAPRSGLFHTALVAATTILIASLATSMVTSFFVVLVDSLKLGFFVHDVPRENSESLALLSSTGIMTLVAGLLALFAVMKLGRRRVTPKLHPSWLVGDDVQEFP
ncbi:MAG: M48 family metalloprotease [Roseomonas sp.]|nr:M48 family metalloprotease [Roseomonas sp.]